MTTTYDLSMSRVAAAGLPAIQQLAGPNDKGEIVTGGNKLAQKYVVILMTEKGSIPYATTRGSNFIALLRMNGMYSEGDVLTAFTGAQLDMSVQLKANTSDPPDEQFVKATIKGITITSEGISISFNILSAAGTGTLVILPLAFILQ